MLIFLLIIILILFVIPRLLVVYVRWRVRRAAERMQHQMDEMFSGAGQQNRSRGSRRRAGWSKPNTQKQYSASDGEYVEFEEIEVTDTEETTDNTDTTSSQTTTTYTRIEDTTWEEIK